MVTHSYDSMPVSASLRLWTFIGYGLFLAGIPTLLMGPLLGVLVAYVKRRDAVGTVWASHFDNMIVTFWVMLGVGLAGIVLTFFLIGFAILGLLILWFYWRMIRGAMRALDGRDYYRRLG